MWMSRFPLCKPKWQYGVGIFRKFLLVSEIRGFKIVTYRQTDRQTDIHTDRQTVRQTPVNYYIDVLIIEKISLYDSDF